MKREVDLFLEEEWRTVKGFPHYMVSNLGKIKSIGFWKQTNNSRRFYKERMLSTRSKYGGSYTLINRKKRKRLPLHILVAQAFVPNPKGHPLVRHLNDIDRDNRATNLAWGTSADNRADASRNGRQSAGSPWAIKVASKLRGQKRTPQQVENIRRGRVRYFKLNEEQVREIKQAFGKVTGAFLAEKYGVDRSQISAIKLGKVWGRVQP